MTGVRRLRNAAVVGLAVSLLASGEPPVTEPEILGYSPELNAFFAQVYRVPDNGRCASYIVDLDKKIRFVLPPQPDIAPSVVAMGEDNERSSCALRAFEAQLDLKLKTPKTMSVEEKSRLEPLLSADWGKPVAGYRDRAAGGLGQWLMAHRPTFAAAVAPKLFELGVIESADGHWLDAYDALMIAVDIKSGLASPESRKQAAQVAAKATKESGPKALLMWEVVSRLDSRAVKPLLRLAASGVGVRRAERLVTRALAVDPVLATRLFREDAEFAALRCEAKFAPARAKWPQALVQDSKCE